MSLTPFPISGSGAAHDSAAQQQQPAWRPALDAIMGARHGGRVEEMLKTLHDLDRRHPNIAEINYQLAWTYEVLERAAEAVPFYEKAIALGLPENELCGALLGLGNTLRLVGTNKDGGVATDSDRTPPHSGSTTATTGTPPTSKPSAQHTPSRELPSSSAGKRVERPRQISEMLPHDGEATNRRHITGSAPLARSAEVLRSAIAQFPDNRELEVFLALTLHAQGHYADALRSVIETLCDTTEDTGITAYQRALRHHASAL